MAESKPGIKPEEILAAEYDYIAQSAFQANEDRARVASFYALSVSSLAAAILGANFLESQYDPVTVNLCFSGAFFFLTIIGFLTTAQLARLRAAWYECALAMNQIKEYCSGKSGTMKLEKAFRWRDLKRVPKFKPNSVSFFLMLEVALLNVVMLGASIFFLQSGLDFTGCWQWPIASGAGLVAGLAQVGLYWLMLRK